MKITSIFVTLVVTFNLSNIENTVHFNINEPSFGIQQQEDLNIILGTWDICKDSVYDNPPDFIDCAYQIQFFKDGTFTIKKESDIVLDGNYNITKNCIYKKTRLYQLELNKNNQYSFKVEKFFPTTSLIIYSKKFQNIAFLDVETKKLISPFFLKKQVL